MAALAGVGENLALHFLFDQAEMAQQFAGSEPLTVHAYYVWPFQERGANFRAALGLAKQD